MPDNIRIVINSLLNVFYLLSAGQDNFVLVSLRPGGVMADIFDVLHAMTELCWRPSENCCRPSPWAWVLGFVTLAARVLARHSQEDVVVTSKLTNLPAGMDKQLVAQVMDSCKIAAERQVIRYTDFWTPSIWGMSCPW